MAPGGVSVSSRELRGPGRSDLTLVALARTLPRMNLLGNNSGTQHTRHGALTALGLAPGELE